MISRYYPLVIIGLACCSCGKDSRRASSVRGDIPHAAVTPSIVDLGTLGAGANGGKEGQFILSNSGSAPLIIARIDASCGCTMPGKIPAVIPSGSEVKVEFTVKPKNVAGEHSSSITVITNDPAQTAIEVSIRWAEESPITITPIAVDFGPVGLDDPVDQLITINTAPFLANIPLRIESSNDEITYELVDSPGGKSVGTPMPTKQIRLQLRKPRRRGIGQARLTISTNDQRFTQTVPVVWKAGPRIEMFPRAFLYSGVSSGAEIECRLLLKASKKDEELFEVRIVEVDGKPVPHRVSQADENEGSAKYITFSIARPDRPGIYRRKARLHLRDEQSSLDVPITVIIR